MPKKIAKNTFYKGMYMDADVSIHPKDAYLYAEELRLVVNEDGTAGSLQNVKGTSVMNIGTTDPIVLIIEAGKDLIVFTKYYKTEVLQHNNIYRVVLDGETVTSSTLIYSDAGKADEDKLNIETTYTVKGVYRKESDDVEKIYWVDGNNYLRYANIAVNLTTDGLPKSGSNDYVSAKTFGTVASVSFTEPELLSSGGGGLNVGMVQYSYQLYNKNGAESSFSPATGLYHLSSSSDSTTNSYNYKGNAVGEESGKSLTFEIALSEYEYTHARIVSIHHEYYSQVPTINIIAEKAIPENGTLVFTDSGSGYIGSYTVEEFTTLAGLYKATDIASSKNFLFLSNITENYFDIGDYDARTYRFNKGTTKKSRNVESNGDVYFVYTDGSWDKVTSTGTPISTGSDWLDIPEDADLDNPYNDTLWDGTRSDTVDTYLGNFKYNISGSEGGSGPNINYTFTYSTFRLDDNALIYRIGTSSKAKDLLGDDTVGFAGYASPYNTANARSYQRDEVYRFGIIFYDKYGRESVVKWIGDIRMPSINSFAFAYKSGGVVYGRHVYPMFQVNNYPEGAVACKIVRVERGENDRTVVTSGMIRPTIYHAEQTCDRPFHPKWITSVTQKEDLQELITPEISFYKSFSIKNDDYLEIHDLENTSISMYDPEHHVVPTLPTEDVSIKYKNVDARTPYTTTSIYGGEVVGLMEDGESTVINSVEFQGFFKDLTGTDEEGYKGTSLIFSGTNNGGWTYSLLTLWAKYAMYRRHIHSSQYNGWSYSAKANSEYISASQIYDIPESGSLNVRAAQGDIFINMFEHTALYYSRDEESVFLNYIFPVESTINLTLRYDDSFTKVYTPLSEAYQSIKEDGDIDSDLSALYLYNTVYSQENNIKKYFPQPEGEEPVSSKKFPSRVIVSEKKFNGEETDSWLKFLTNNFIDVDAVYGEVNNIMDYNNNLLFWQDRAIGSIAVDPRSLITDSSSVGLVLGTGAVLSRFDYISTLTGNTNPFGIVKTPYGIYWYDSIRNIISKYNSKEIVRLSKVRGVQSFLNKNMFENAVASYMPKYDEILLTLTNGTGSDRTIVFNEMVDYFTGFYNMIPSRSALSNNNLITIGSDSLLYMHDTSTSEYGIYYDDSTPNESYVRILVNDDPDVVKVFDAINFPLYVRDSSDVLKYSDTFDTIKCYNSYQNTDEIALIKDTNISRDKGMWSIEIPRNVVSVSPTLDPDIHDPANLDSTRLYKERLRDLYMLVELKYNNTDNYKINFPYMHTKYRLNYR